MVVFLDYYLLKLTLDSGLLSELLLLVVLGGLFIFIVLNEFIALSCCGCMRKGLVGLLKLLLALLSL